MAERPQRHLLNARRVQLTPGCRNEASASRLSMQIRFERWARCIVSSADTSNMRRPGGIGPCRSDMITMPPPRSNAETFGIASSRCTSSRCIHTAVSMTRSKSSLRALTAAKSGKLSSSHSIIGDGCRRIAPRRSSSVSSTATTELPEGDESCCIAPRTRSDIESATRSGRDQLQNRRMRICKRDTLIAFEQLRSLVGIVFGSADPSRLHGISFACEQHPSNYNSCDLSRPASSRRWS
jgi:hypothetical protein